MKTHHWIAAVIGLLFVALSLWQFRAAEAGLLVTSFHSGTLPVTIITPAGETSGNRPLVLIGHGLAGSRVIMRPFALTLAYAGYDVVLWDFAGHGANPQPFPSDRTTAVLTGEAETALQSARARGLGASGRVAILGHSMGSGVALYFGQAHPDTSATIAVSPVQQSVTPELPHNLLLMAGSREAPFLDNARHLLSQAGGAGGDPAAGTARQLVVVPGVEHISILFSPYAAATARQWLDSIFRPQPGGTAYTDLGILWYLLGLTGSLLFFWSLSPLVKALSIPEAAHPAAQPLWRRIGALLIGALAATLLLWLLQLAGLDLSRSFRLLVGGYLLLWFAIAGLASLLLLGMRPSRITWQILLESLLAFAALWLGVGLLGQLAWLQWLLIPVRLLLWPLGVLLILPWMLAIGQAFLPGSRIARAGWWLGYSALLVGCLYLALRLTPELGFLGLILPVFPLVLGLHALAAGPYNRSWSFALSGALFLGWTVLAVFPLQ